MQLPEVQVGKLVVDSKERIKPNTVKPAPSGSGLITDARVVVAVVKQVLEQNPRKVIIGEGASVGYDFPGRRDSFRQE